MTRRYRLVAATGLHKGDRAYQQDQVLILNHPRASDCVLGVVADGMGGRSGGRKASDQVMLTARQLFSRFSPASDDPSKMLLKLLDEAHTVIKMTAITAEQEPHSTVAAFVLLPDRSCTWIHAGDSRIYHFHCGRLVTRTSDHSYVQALVDRGDIDAADAEAHPQSNILLGCLGMKTRPPPVVLHKVSRMRRNDTLLICTDGLWHYFPPEELGVAIHEYSPRAAVELLVSEARKRAMGGGDNLAIAVLRLEPVDDPETP